MNSRFGKFAATNFSCSTTPSCASLMLTMIPRPQRRRLLDRRRTCEVSRMRSGVPPIVIPKSQDQLFPETRPSLKMIGSSLMFVTPVSRFPKAAGFSLAHFRRARLTSSSIHSGQLRGHINASVIPDRACIAVYVANLARSARCHRRARGRQISTNGRRRAERGRPLRAGLADRRTCAHSGFRRHRTAGATVACTTFAQAERGRQLVGVILRCSRRRRNPRRTDRQSLQGRSSGAPDHRPSARYRSRSGRCRRDRRLAYGRRSTAYRLGSGRSRPRQRIAIGVGALDHDGATIQLRRTYRSPGPAICLRASGRTSPRRAGLPKAILGRHDGLHLGERNSLSLHWFEQQCFVCADSFECALPRASDSFVASIAAVWPADWSSRCRCLLIPARPASPLDQAVRWCYSYGKLPLIKSLKSSPLSISLAVARSTPK